VTDRRPSHLVEARQRKVRAQAALNMPKAAGPPKAVLGQREVREAVLPAYMLFLLFETLEKNGIRSRVDVLRYLNIAQAEPFQRLRRDVEPLDVARAVDMDARSVLRDANAGDDLRLAILAVCRFILLLVQGGKFKDVHNQAVLAANLLLDDATGDPVPDPGGVGWGYDPIKVANIERKIAGRAAFLGYYL
jgi:hypothetical protein